MRGRTVVGVVFKSFDPRRHGTPSVSRSLVCWIQAWKPRTGPGEGKSRLGQLTNGGRKLRISRTVDDRLGDDFWTTLKPSNLACKRRPPRPQLRKSALDVAPLAVLSWKIVPGVVAAGAVGPKLRLFLSAVKPCAAVGRDGAPVDDQVRVLTDAPALQAAVPQPAELPPSPNGRVDISPQSACSGLPLARGTALQWDMCGRNVARRGVTILIRISYSFVRGLTSCAGKFRQYHGRYLIGKIPGFHAKSEPCQQIA
jgi:hypothetical protein